MPNDADIAPPTPASSLRRALAPVGWALYLAASWTWCIGMFLPVLLVRDHGVLGFLVFALPNCLGAAAMGWVLARGDRADPTDRSARIVRTHRGALAAFSAVTIAFHVFFLVWLATWIRLYLPPPAGPLGTSTAAILLLLATLVGGAVLVARGLAVRYAALVWCVSAAFLVALVLSPNGVAPPATAYFDAPDPAAIRGLLWLAPVCVFGFLLCPYLDGTFHLAAQRCAQTSGVSGTRAAFTVGFLVFFAAMILCTLLYAGFFAAVFDADDSTRPSLTRPLAVLLMAHLICQAMFTVQVHHDRYQTLTRPLPDAPADPTPATPPGPAPVWAIPALWALCLVAGLAAYFWRTYTIPATPGLTSGEAVYRVFMSFYGLVFPAYVYLLAIPLGGPHADRPSRRTRLLVFAVAVVLAAPAYWTGFLARDFGYLALGLGIVLVARVPLILLARRR